MRGKSLRAKYFGVAFYFCNLSPCLASPAAQTKRLPRLLIPKIGLCDMFTTKGT